KGGQKHSGIDNHTWLSSYLYFASFHFHHSYFFGTITQRDPALTSGADTCALEARQGLRDRSAFSSWTQRPALVAARASSQPPLIPRQWSSDSSAPSNPCRLHSLQGWSDRRSEAV